MKKWWLLLSLGVCLPAFANSVFIEDHGTRSQQANGASCAKRSIAGYNHVNSCGGWANRELGLASVSMDDKTWGVAKFDGQLIIPLAYQSIYFCGEYIEVKQNDKFGLIDINNKQFIEPKYESLSCPTKQYAIAQQNGKYGLINLSDKPMTEFRYQQMRFLNDELIKVRENDQYGAINTDGKIIANIKYQDIREDDGYLRVSYQDKGGVIDRTGKTVLPFDYELIGWINEHKIIIAKKEQEQIKYGFADLKTGKTLVKPMYDKVSAFHDGMAAVRVDDHWGFVNEQGKMVIEPQFAYVDDFSEGIAKIGEKTGEHTIKYAYIDKKGLWISLDLYDDAEKFKNGLAGVVKINNGVRQRAYIDQTGKPIGGRWYHMMGHFYDGVTTVTLNGKMNLIDRQGNILSDVWFDDILPFSGELRVVKLDGKYGYINTKGEMVIPLQFDNAHPFFDNQKAKVRLNDKWYYINHQGVIIDTAE